MERSLIDGILISHEGDTVSVFDISLFSVAPRSPSWACPSLCDVFTQQKTCDSLLKSFYLQFKSKRGKACLMKEGSAKWCN